MATKNQGKKREDGRTRSAGGDHITPQPPHQSTTPLERPASRLSALLLASASISAGSQPPVETGRETGISEPD